MKTPDGPPAPPQKGCFSGPTENPTAGLSLGVFAKHWTPGATKTRLAESVGPIRAAQLSREFLKTTLKRLASITAVDAQRVVVYSPTDKGDDFERLTFSIDAGWRCMPQAGGSLGERMKHYFQTTTTGVLLGSDSPDLPVGEVKKALAWLGEAETGRRVVLGPSDDGGYWLIGARGALPPIFDGMPWSEPSLLAATLERLHEAGWSDGTDYRLLERWYDVDDASGLARLRSGLAQGDPDLQELAAAIDALLGVADP